MADIVDVCFSFRIVFLRTFWLVIHPGLDDVVFIWTRSYTAFGQVIKIVPSFGCLWRSNFASRQISLSFEKDWIFVFFGDFVARDAPIVTSFGLEAVERSCVKIWTNLWMHFESFSSLNYIEDWKISSNTISINLKCQFFQRKIARSYFLRWRIGRRVASAVTPQALPSCHDYRFR